jgi:hypothetical protein
MLPAAEFLTPAEVKAAAGGAASIADQAATLKANGIPHRLVGRRLLVSRYHVRAWLQGEVVAPRSEPKLELVR